jgi:SAM-dependent methyltransferase
VTQHTGGLHAVLSRPWVYETYQRAVGSHHLWQSIIERLDLSPGDRLLDIGCGPGDVVAYLPDVDYVGFDLSEAYIERATERYGSPRHRFLCADVGTVDVDALGAFDAVLAHGVLHHVDDDVAGAVFAVAARALRPGGRLITVDGAYVPGQSRVARFLLDQDRGRCVRSPEAYVALAEPAFTRVEIQVDHHLLRIPYTMAILEASEPRQADGGGTRAAT